MRVLLVGGREARYCYAVDGDIRMNITSSGRSRARRITISVREDLVRGLDSQVAAGVADSRTDLINDAIARELRRLRNEAIDAEILALAHDPEYQAMDEQLTKEFETSDSEAWAMLDKDFGPEQSV